MRGYLSFLLVLAILVGIFAFLAPFPALHASSDSRAIEAERTNAVSMNAKEALAESTSYWLRASATAYDLLPEPEKNPIERKLAIKAGILGGWALLAAGEDQFGPDFEVKFWCGHITSRTKPEHSKTMIAQGNASVCPGCYEIWNPICTEYIIVEQKDPAKDLDDNVHLTSSTHLGAGFGVVGASIYSPRYKTANLVYIPITEEIK